MYRAHPCIASRSLGQTTGSFRQIKSIPDGDDASIYVIPASCFATRALLMPVRSLWPLTLHSFFLIPFHPSPQSPSYVSHLSFIHH
jgi:hypothetical protein